MTSTTVVPLAHENKALAAAALARAYHNDPFQSYILPDEHQRALRSPAHFSAILEYGLQFGDVYSAPENHGASVCLGPGAWDLNEKNANAAGLDRLVEVLGEEGAHRYFDVIGTIGQFHRRIVPAEHLYVMVMGVCPSSQGCGLGRLLLEPIFESSRSKKLPIYVETANSKNIEFYKHLGFETLGEVEEPKSGLRFWAFRRDRRQI